MNGQIHSSLQVRGIKEENFYLDRAWFGFDAYTPKGFAKLNLQLEELQTTVAHENDLPAIIREAYTGMSFNDNWRFMLGMKNVPYGMLEQDSVNTLGIDGVNYLMGLKQANGLQIQFTQNRWKLDFGLFNPAYRAQFISSETKVIESLSEAPLFTTRLAYQIGQLLHIQGSIAVQDYENNSTFDRTYHATRYYDFGIDIDFSPVWGAFYNYSQVDHAYASLSGDSRTASLIQFDWTPDRFWQLYVRVNEAFDKDIESQLLLYVGAVYQADKHNRLLINANLGSNNKDYTGFLGEQKQSFLLQYQFNF